MNKYKMKSDVMIRDDRGQTLVFKAREGRLFEVNATVERVLRSLSEAKDLDELIEHLGQKHAIDADDRRILEETVAEIEALGLIETVQQ